MSLRNQRQLESCMQLYIHIPIINEGVLPEVLELLPEGREWERVPHWKTDSPTMNRQYPDMFFVKMAVERDEVLGFPADHRLGFSSHTTEELFSNRSIFCALCSLPILDATKAEWEDNIFGCKYDVHEECVKDRELTARFNNAVAGYLYGDGESDLYPVEDGIIEYQDEKSEMHQTNYPDIKKFVVNGNDSESQ